MKKECVESMVRVNHAGEYAAVCIYHGQALAFKNTQEEQQILEMQQHEKQHFAYFDGIIKKRGIRPTFFLPLWHVAAVGMGYITAKMGKESAMACTEAVEEVICKHYDAQAKLLKNCSHEKELLEKVVQFREEEAEHMNIAVKEGAEHAPSYAALSLLVKTACRIGIAISKMV